MQVTEEMMRKQEFFIKFRTQMSDLQAEILWVLIRNKGCFNSMEICRIVNGFAPRDFKPCYVGQEFGKTRPERCNFKKRGCRVWSLRVYDALQKLERTGAIKSRKTKFWDATPLRTDTFRFWFLGEEAYLNRVEKQTLLPHIFPSNLNQKECDV